jgi:hypothetical protein
MNLTAVSSLAKLVSLAGDGGHSGWQKAVR